MKKYLITTAVLVLVLTGLAVAAAPTPGDPLNAAFAQIQEQIDSILTRLDAVEAKNTEQDAKLNLICTNDPTLCATAPPPPPPPPPADTTPPLTPVLSLGPVTQTSMTLNWQPGVDNIGVDHYNVFLNGNKIAETNLLTWTYTGLTCGTFYNQGLTVEDAAGNTSNLAEATWGRSTAACGGSGG